MAIADGVRAVRRWGVWAALAVAAGGVAGGVALRSTAGEVSRGGVLGEVAEDFDAHAGEVRVLAVLSPT